jgi:hypothetical protein
MLKDISLIYLIDNLTMIMRLGSDIPFSKYMKDLTREFPLCEEVSHD